MIRFGARLDVYLPDDYNPKISVGRKTLAGQTILARRREEAPHA
jgi:phosphatidylserine decarboxylase